MEIIIKGTAKEIADLVLAIQGQPRDIIIKCPIVSPKDRLFEILKEAIRDKHEDKR